MSRLIVLLLVILISFTGCAYFNTFYLAQKNFKDAEHLRDLEDGAVSATTKNLYNDAAEWAFEILKNNRDSRYVDDSLYIIGMSYYHTNDITRARTKFNELITAFPESEYVLDAKYYKARSLMQLKMNDEAREVLNDLINSGDRKMKGLGMLALAEILFEDKQWDELLISAQKLIDSDPQKDELVKAIIYKGDALFNLERYDECTASMKLLLDYSLEPEYRFLSNSLLAESIAKSGDFETALSYLTILQNKGEYIPYEPRIRLEIGKIYEVKGDRDEAIDAYTKMAGDYPDSLAAKEAWFRIGSLLIEDLSKAKEAKDAFDMVEKGRARSQESWVVGAKIKSAQIDTMFSRIELIDKIEEDPDFKAYIRFSLAELYTFSFDRADSAITQYRFIVEEAPDTEYAIMSDFFLRKNDLEQAGESSEDSEHDVMLAIINDYPDSDFSKKLQVYLGIIDVPEDVDDIQKAEDSKLSGSDADVYIPLYQAIVDDYPDTESHYQARFVMAYSYEHDVGDIEKSIELYKQLASETPSFINREYVEKAREKIEFYEREPELIKAIDNYIAGFDAGDTLGVITETVTEEAIAPVTVDADKGLTGQQKLRSRNARIRSRYFTD